MMYEHKTEPLLSRAAFMRRIFGHIAVAAVLVLGSLLLGMTGYVTLENLHWLDAFVDAAMLLGGMGPVHIPVTTAGKLLAGCYALYCGLVFLVAVGLVFAPLLHRVLHRLHLDRDDL